MEQNIYNKEYNLYEFTQCLKPNIDCIIERIGVPETVIELGVYEGYFTINMTHSIAPQFPNYKHYAIDPYALSTDLNESDIERAHERFLNNLNLSPFNNNIEFIHNTSWNGMIDLYNRGVKADLIYVDGDHRAREVLNDMVLAYKLLNFGGVMLCDDSVSWCWTDTKNQTEIVESKPLQESPRLAVDSFIQCNWGVVEVMNLPSNYQTAFIKRSI